MNIIVKIKTPHILLLMIFLFFIMTGAAIADETSHQDQDMANILPVIYFDYDSVNIASAERGKLIKLAHILKQNQQIKLCIEGHTDERGSDEYNLNLGEQMASAVKLYLATEGVAVSRLYIISYGAEAPRDPGHDEVAWARNRRVSFRLFDY